MSFSKLSCFLLIVTCIFITGSKVPLPAPPEGMVLIPAGEFQMGSNDPEAQNNEQPVHPVYIDTFFMDKHEVTNLAYQKFLLANPRWRKDRIDSNFHDGDYLKHWNGNDYPQWERRTTRWCM